MANTYLLSDEAKRYLCCYYQILDGMIQGVSAAKLTQSISHNYIVQLLPQHRAAVRLCRNLLDVSNDGAVRCLAQRISAREAEAIEALEAELPNAGQLTSPQMDLRLFQRRSDLIFREMYTQMGAVPEGNRVDILFLRQMIPHRQGGIRAARTALRYEVSTGLAPLLRSAIDAQNRDAAQMRALLNRRGCQSCQ